MNQFQTEKFACARSESRSQNSQPTGEPSPEQEKESSVALDEEIEKLWKVIVWNDPVNLMSYVVYVLQRLFGYNINQATQLMLEVHNDGKSIVKLTEQEKGERYVSRLHSYGLQATMEKDE
ncbi:MAG: ATP-dependent Clp protease adapter ClpS [Planctomycetota bacterium]